MIIVINELRLGQQGLHVNRSRGSGIAISLDVAEHIVHNEKHWPASTQVPIPAIVKHDSLRLETKP
jgi:hypothetical protein